MKMDISEPEELLNAAEEKLADLRSELTRIEGYLENAKKEYDGWTRRSTVLSARIIKLTRAVQQLKEEA